MTAMLLLIALALIFVGLALIVIGFFKPVPDMDYDAAFRVSVDNLDRSTMFDIPDLQPVLWPFVQLARRLSPDSLRQRVLRNLRSSGNPSGYSPDEFLTVCLMAGLGVGAVMTLLMFLLDNQIQVIFMLPGFVIGALYMEMSLASKATKRLRSIRQQLPYALDLLSMTMQAGATFYEAARTVANDQPSEPLNQELGIVVREIEFGRSRQEALQHLGDRIPVDSLSSIIAAILQAEQLGTPLADVLRLQANLLRMHRSMSAEKALGEANVKLLLPLVLIFMAAILIVFAPIIVRFVKGDFFGI